MTPRTTRTYLATPPAWQTIPRTVHQLMIRRLAPKRQRQKILRKPLDEHRSIAHALVAAPSLIGLKRRKLRK
jgi:hypothetical protein